LRGIDFFNCLFAIVGIAPRILAAIERVEGNPTIDTLNKVGRPFGYKVGFVSKHHDAAL